MSDQNIKLLLLRYLVVASEAEIIEVLPLAEAIQQKEDEALQRMAHGESLLGLFNLLA